MTAYNGHRSWNAWNIALWIGSDEHLYREAVAALKTTTTIRQASTRFFFATGLRDQRTPDGAIYNRRCVREALAGLEIHQPED